MRIAVVSTKDAPCRGTKSLWGDMFAFSPRSIGVLALTLLYDPAFLGACPSPVAVEELSCADAADAAASLDLLVVAHPLGRILPAALTDAIDRGLPTLLAAPEPETLAGLGVSSRLASLGRLLSMDEEWRLDGRVFDYPQALYFERWRPPAGAEVLSTIGEWPDAVVLGPMALMATDSFHAADLFRPIPSQHWPGGFQDLFPRHLARVLAAVLGLPEERPRPGGVQEEYDLRRDFHAFGYARLMAARLLAILGRADALSPADQAAWSAARSWRGGLPAARVQEELAEAFAALTEPVMRAAPLPRYLLDSLHGGIILGGHGFAEYDSPRYVRDWFELYAHWTQTRGYRFSVEIGAGTLAAMAARYPAHAAKMAALWRNGAVEVVNGTRAQPYPWLLPLASNAMQFALGQEALQETFGRRAESYVAQEFGLTTRHPGLLRQFDYSLACHRVQNWGRVPAEKNPACLWQGADGGSILALAGGSDRSEQRIGTIYLEWPEITAAAVTERTPFLALTNLLDFFWMPAFREETIRANHYAPIFGRFLTFHDLRRILPEVDPPVRRYMEDDYEPEAFSRYPWAGGIAGTMLRALEAENFLREADLLNCLALLSGVGGRCDTRRAWEALLDFENHDCFCVPHAEAGGHTSHYTSIVGPRRSITVLEAATAALETALSDLVPARDRLLDRLGTLVSGPGEWLALNSCPFPVRLCRPLPEGRTLLADLPALGLARVDAVPAPVTVDDRPCLANGLLRVEISPVTGSLAVADQAGPLWREANSLVWRDREHSRTELGEIEISRSPYWQRAEMRGRVIGGDGWPVALWRMHLTLARDSRLLELRTELSPVRRERERIAKEGPPPLDQWKHSLKAEFIPAARLAGVACLGQEVPEETGKSRIISPAGLCLTAGAYRSLLHTRALPHFLRDGDRVALVLWHAREERMVFEYALEVLGPEDPIVSRSLAYQRPPLVRWLPAAAGGRYGRGRSVGLLGLGHDDGLDVFAFRAMSDRLELWCAEIAGREREMAIRPPAGWERAELCSLDGEDRRPLTLIAGALHLNLRPWRLFCLSLRRSERDEQPISPLERSWD
ncbi:MAG: hypothetical protein ACM3XS_08675, partial [Bacteroidota bacterium]